MPSFVHQAMVELFRFRETLAAEIVERLCGVTLPRFSRVSFREADLGEVVPTDRRADLVVVLENDKGEPVLAIIVEVQLRRDADKSYVWPLYQAALRARLRCPCAVLVVTPSRTVARWAERAVDTGQPGASFRPLVLGPQRVPRVATVEAARDNIELALLSVIAHGRATHGPPILQAAAQATLELEGTRSVIYFELLWQAAGEALRRHLEEQMRVGKFEFQNEYLGRLYQKCLEAEQRGREEGRREGQLEGKLEGKIEGQIEGILRILKARHIPVTDEQRARIRSCTDLPTLDQWLERAVSLDSTEELFH